MFGIVIGSCRFSRLLKIATIYDWYGQVGAKLQLKHNLIHLGEWGLPQLSLFSHCAEYMYINAISVPISGGLPRSTRGESELRPRAAL